MWIHRWFTHFWGSDSTFPHLQDYQDFMRSASVSKNEETSYRTLYLCWCGFITSSIFSLTILVLFFCVFPTLAVIPNVNTTTKTQLHTLITTNLATTVVTSVERKSLKRAKDLLQPLNAIACYPHDRNARATVPGFPARVGEGIARW